MVDSAKMAIYLYPGKILADHLSIKSHLRDAPRDTHGATADYDDTALGTGTLTVHGEQVLTVENYYYYLIVRVVVMSRKLELLLHTSYMQLPATTQARVA